MGFNKGNKYGREPVRAVSDPLQGELLNGQVRSTGVNQWLGLSATGQLIEGVAVKALSTNTGSVFVCGRGQGQAGFELAASESVALAIDDLVKVVIFAPANGDGVCWLAIETVGE